jgi:hypothetical protein
MSLSATTRAERRALALLLLALGLAAAVALAWRAEWVRVPGASG